MVCDIYDSNTVFIDEVNENLLGKPGNSEDQTRVVATASYWPLGLKRQR
jgi:hypothetical protein